MAIEIVPIEPEHVDECGRICFESFRDIETRHGFEPDFPTAEIPRSLIEMAAQRDDIYGVVALDEGQVAGSNFLWTTDPVAGLGPITVDGARQGRGIGRVLMQNVLDYAQDRGIRQVRLMQDAHNITSLSLYASLGFDVKTPAMMMQIAPSDEDAEGVRPVTEDDLPAIGELSERIYRTSRRNEVAVALQGPFMPLLREREGRVTAYFIPGMLGHGVAETDADALALIGESARHLPPPLARFFCPLCEGDFYRAAMQAGHRAIRVMNLMALGPYEAPVGSWMPSISY